MSQPLNISSEIDLKQILRRFMRAWPSFALAFVIFIGIAILLELFFFPIYEAKTSILIENPQRINDPSRMATGEDPSRSEANYYINEQVKLSSFPIVFQTVKNLNLNITYFNKGLILDEDIYTKSPFKVEVMNETDFVGEEIDIDEPLVFYIRFIDLESFNIESDNELPEGNENFVMSDQFKFGEEISFGECKFKIILNSDYNQSSQVAMDDMLVDWLGFEIANPDAVALEIMSSITVEPAQLEASVLGVSMYGNPKEKIIDLLNNLGQTYINKHLEEKLAVYDKALNFINIKLDNIKDSLLINERNIQTYKSEKEITNLGEESKILLQEITRLEAEKADLIVLENYYSYLTEFLLDNNNYNKLISPQAFGLADKNLNELTSELMSLQLEKTTMEIENKQANPTYSYIVRKIETYRQNILETVEGFATSNEMLLSNLNIELWRLKQEQKELPGTESELMNRYRFFEFNEKLFDDLMERKVELEISKASIEADFKIIEPAYLTSLDPFFPMPIINFPIAFILAILIPVSLISIKSLFNNKILSQKDFTYKNSNHKYHGQILHTNILYPNDLLNFKNSTTFDNISAIGYSIFAKNNVSRIAFTSISPKTGKSFVSSLLAANLSIRGKKVLIIDCDIKIPAIHKYFELENLEGLSELLNGINLENNGIQKTKFANVDILTAGRIKDVAMYNLNNILDNITKDYDITIFDTAPIDNFADTIEILRITDKNIFVLRRNYSFLNDIEKISNYDTNYEFENLEILFNDALSENKPNKAYKKYYKNKPNTFKSRMRKSFKS